MLVAFCRRYAYCRFAELHFFICHWDMMRGWALFPVVVPALFTAGSAYTLRRTHVKPKSVIRPQCLNFYSYIIASCRLMSFCRRLFFVWHKYIIRLSPNDRFGLNYVLAEVMCLCRTSVFGMCHIVIRERSFIVKCLFVLQEVAFRKAKGHLSLCERCPLQGVVNQNVMPPAVADGLSVGDYMDGTSSPSSSHEVKPISSAFFLSNAK